MCDSTCPEYNNEIWYVHEVFHQISSMIFFYNMHTRMQFKYNLFIHHL